MVLVTVVVHVLGFYLLTIGIRRVERRIHAGRHLGTGHRGTGRPEHPTLTVAAVFAGAIVVVFLIHTVEAWAWALLYLALGAFETLEAALYFSTATFTTVGYGDVVLDERWRLLAALESSNGIVMIGVSTAILFAALTRIMRGTGLMPPD